MCVCVWGEYRTNKVRSKLVITSASVLCKQNLGLLKIIFPSALNPWQILEGETDRTQREGPPHPKPCLCKASPELSVGQLQGMSFSATTAWYGDGKQAGGGGLLQVLSAAGTTPSCKPQPGAIPPALSAVTAFQRGGEFEWLLISLG